MNYKHYAKCFRQIYKEFGITISILIAALGVLLLSISRCILEDTIFAKLFLPTNIEKGMVRCLATLFTVVLIIALGMARKFRILKKHHVLKGFLYCYPMISIAVSVIFVGTVTNVMMNDSFILYGVWGLAFYMLFIGLFEELLYRGLIQNILLAKFSKHNWFFAVFIQAILFGAAHAVNNTDALSKYTQCVFSFFVGFFFGVAYYRTKSILSCVIVHAFYDFALNFYTCFLVVDSGTKVENGINWWTCGLAFVLSLLLCITKIYLKERKRTYKLEEVEKSLGLTAINEEWKAAYAAFFIDKKVKSL